MITDIILPNLQRFSLRLVLGAACLSTLAACGVEEVAPQPVVTAPAAEAIDPNPASTVRFGILAIDSALSVHDRYGPLLDYLSQATGYSFKLVALNQDSQFSQVATDDLDFVASNPLAAVQIQRLYETQFLTTLERPQTGSQFSALIITHQDSDIQQFADLKGKRVACVDFETAAAGCLFQIFHLLKNDVDPFQDFASFVENPSQDSIVFAVLNRTIDAGFIRTGQLERMVKSGILDETDDIRILAPQNDSFFFPHTTELYPEWPIAALPTTDPELVQAVKAALFNIPEQHPALAAANLSGFAAPANYTPIHNLIETLQLKSWDAQ